MPVIEEIDDDEIDSKHFSLEDFDPHNPFSRDMPVEEGAPVQLHPTNVGNRAPSSSQPTSSSSKPSNLDAALEARRAQFDGPDESNAVPVSSSRQFRQEHSRDIPEHMKTWKVIYPVYFDKTRTVSQGRRVPYEQAVLNPLAVMISDACLVLGYEAALEVTKQHPKDWANPGRVRVNLPEGTSKREIYQKISGFLKSNPVTKTSSRESMYRKYAQFDEMKPLATPRNMRFPKVVPGVSPVVSARKSIDESMKMDGNEMFKMMGMA